MKRLISISIVPALLVSLSGGTLPSYAAESLSLPLPGKMVHLSPVFNPPMLLGLKVHPENPFRFDFILDPGRPEGTEGPLKEQPKAGSSVKDSSASRPQDDYMRLIKYFLASLTVPEKDLWVNLSPYEKDRIVPDAFGKTEMGRDLLAQDYLLKQLTASLIYPEGETGKKFWNKVYAEAAKRYGNTNVPVNTFNKVWIMPDKAVVYENAKAGTAYVVESKLKVMLEEDYLAATKNRRQPGDMFKVEQPRTCPQAGCQATKGSHVKAPQGTNGPRSEPTAQDDSEIASQILRDLVIPQLTKEVNEGQNFAQLRQVYNSLILANWYKKKIKDSILAKVYADKNKIEGLLPTRGHVQDRTTKNVSPSGLPSNNGLNVKATEGTDPLDVDAIYHRYLEAFKKGAYNYIKEEIDPATRQPIPRKYFSGGLVMRVDPAMIIEHTLPFLSTSNPGQMEIEVRLDQAMSVPADALFQDQAQVRAILSESRRHPVRVHSKTDRAFVFPAKTKLNPRQVDLNLPAELWGALNEEMARAAKAAGFRVTDISVDNIIVQVGGSVWYLAQSGRPETWRLAGDLDIFLYVPDDIVGTGELPLFRRHLSRALVERMELPSSILGINVYKLSQLRELYISSGYYIGSQAVLERAIPPGDLTILLSNPLYWYLDLYNKAAADGEDPQKRIKLFYQMALLRGDVEKMGRAVDLLARYVQGLDRMGVMLEFQDMLKADAPVFARENVDQLVRRDLGAGRKAASGRRVKGEYKARSSVDAAMLGGLFTKGIVARALQWLGQLKGLADGKGYALTIHGMPAPPGTPAYEAVKDIIQLAMDDEVVKSDPDLLAAVLAFKRIAEHNLSILTGETFGMAELIREDGKMVGLSVAIGLGFVLELLNRARKFHDPTYMGLAIGILIKEGETLRDMERRPDFYLHGPAQPTDRELHSDEQLKQYLAFLTEAESVGIKPFLAYLAKSYGSDQLIAQLTYLEEYEENARIASWSNRAKNMYMASRSPQGGDRVLRAFMLMDSVYPRVNDQMQERINKIIGGQTMYAVRTHARLDAAGLERLAFLDRAQVAASSFDKGGIDLSTANDISVQHNGPAIKMGIDPAQLRQFQGAAGFTPVIINILPIPDLRQFLGLNDAPAVSG